jgi:hypothetical protein
MDLCTIFTGFDDLHTSWQPFGLHPSKAMLNDGNTVPILPFLFSTSVKFLARTIPVAKRSSILVWHPRQGIGPLPSQPNGHTVSSNVLYKV